MLQRVRDGGKLPSIRILAFCGKNGSRGCLSVFMISYTVCCIRCYFFICFLPLTIYMPGLVISCSLRPARSYIVLALLLCLMSSMLNAVSLVTVIFFSWLFIATIICSSFVEAMSSGAISSPAATAMNPLLYILLLPVAFPMRCDRFFQNLWHCWLPVRCNIVTRVILRVL